MSKPQAPTPTDPRAITSAQTASNADTAQLQQKLNMVNTNSPYGSVSYQVDPSAPGGYSQTTALSPEQQALYEGQTAAQKGALGAANTAIGNVQTALGKTLNPSDYGTLTSNVNSGPIQNSVGPTNFTQDRQDVSNAVYNQATSRLDPQFQLAHSQLDTKLANQGLGANSAAYQNAQGILGRQQNDAYNQANYSGIQEGANEQNTLFNQALNQGNFANQAQNQQFGQGYQNATLANTAQQQGFQQAAYAQSLPIQEFSQLLGLGQITAPTGVAYTPTSVSPTDVTGAYALNAQQQNAAYQAQMQQQTALLGGLSQLGGAAITKFSDRRLKRDVSVVGVRPDGLYVYAYRYVGSRTRQVGVMAQEVLRVKPQAVVQTPSGYLAVNYGLL